jgi:WD40 repeat protein
MRYKAFLSYSHTADRARAAAVHSALHRFAKPWYRVRAVHVFRDETNLAATPGLWPTIQAALDDSEFFILLASPAAAASSWVAKEVEHWCSTRGSATLLIVLTGGTIVWDEQAGDVDWRRTTALPRTLRGRFAAEPLWVDLTWAKENDDFSLRHIRFRGAIATLAAPLHNRSKEELDSDDIRQHRRTLLIVRSVIAVLAFLVVLFYWQYRVAESRRRLGLSRQLAAQAATLIDDHYDRALLLCAQALQFAPTLEARNALFSTLAAAPHPSTFLRIKPDINRLAFSADNTVLVAGTLGDSDLLVWDLGGRSPAPRSIDADFVGNRFSLAFPPSGNVFAAATKGGIALWNARTGRREPQKFDVPEGADSLAFSPDGRSIAFVDRSGAIHLRGRAHGQALAWPIAAGLKQSDPIVFSRDGRLLAAAGEGGTIRLWPIAALDPHAAPPPPQALQVQFMPGVRHDRNAPDILNIGFAGDGTTLIAGTDDGVRLWEIENDRVAGEPRAIRVIPFDAPLVVSTYALSADGKTLAAGCSDGSVRLWNLVEGTTLERPLTGHANDIWALALSADGSRLAAGHQDGVIRIWELTSHSVGRTLEVARNDQGPFLFIPRSAKMATADRDGIHIRNHDGRSLNRLPDSSFSVMSLAVDPNGRRLAAGGEDGRIRVWDLRSGKLAFPLLAGHSGKVFAVAFGTDETRLASGDSRGSMALWELNEPQRGRMVTFRIKDEKPPSIWKVACDPSGERCFGATSAGTLVWARTSEGPAFAGFADGLDMAFSSDAKLLAAQDYDEAVRLWHVDEKKAIGPPVAAINSVYDMAFSPNGRLLAITDGGGVLRLWDVATGQRFGPALYREKGSSHHIAFRGDSAVLAVEEGGHVVLWDLDLSSWLQRARTTANRNLTIEEWRHYIPDDAYKPTFADLSADRDF